MPIEVSDFASNADEQIEHAARAIGRSDHRRRVFEAVYWGKRRVKSVGLIARKTGLSRKQVLDAGKPLASNHVMKQVKDGRDTAYMKIDFMHEHKSEILNLAGNLEKLAKHPTKRNLQVRLPRTIALLTRGARALPLTIDDISSFNRARRIKTRGYLPGEVSEQCFKKGIQAILGEPGRFTDWGGEKNDLLSTRLQLGGKRRTVAFAFKGPGTKGKLTPGKMGKHGDQIQRLFQSPAQVFLVQYWREIDESVLEQMKSLAIARSITTGTTVWYGVIDGVDSRRVYEAYRPRFRPGGGRELTTGQ